MRKKLILIFLILVFLVFLSSCRDRVETDDYGYVIAIGVDKGEDDGLKITFSFADPLKIGGGSSEDEGGNKDTSNLINYTIDAKSLFTGLDVLKNNISKDVNLSHVKIIIFSSKVAKGGLSEYIDGFIREFKIRPITYMAVANTNAQKYLESLSPNMAINPEKYIKDLFSHGENSFISKIDIYNFYFQTLVEERSIVLPLVGVISEKEEKNQKINDEIKENSADNSDIPLKSKNKASIIGSAVFRGDKLVYEGKNSENIYIDLFRGEAGEFDYTLSEGINDDIVLTVIQRYRPRITVDTLSKKPLINIVIPLECEISSMATSKTNEDEYKKIERMFEKDLHKNLIKYAKKSTEEIKSDVSGFGRYAKKNFLTWNEWKNYNWDKKYENAVFKIKIEPKINKFGILDKGFKP